MKEKYVELRKKMEERAEMGTEKIIDIASVVSVFLFFLVGGIMFLFTMEKFYAFCSIVFSVACLSHIRWFTDKYSQKDGGKK